MHNTNIDTNTRNIGAHISNKSNPHNVTKAQVGLGSVDNTADSAKNVLSASKWTTARTFTIGSTAKSVNGTTNVSWSLTEIGAAAISHGTHVSFSASNPKSNGTASPGSASTVARSDHIHPLQTSVSGNAGTATKLQTARNITIGEATKSFNGTVNIAFTLAEIGASSITYTNYTKSTLGLKSGIDLLDSETSIYKFDNGIVFISFHAYCPKSVLNYASAKTIINSTALPTELRPARVVWSMGITMDGSWLDVYPITFNILHTGLMEVAGLNQRDFINVAIMYKAQTST